MDQYPCERSHGNDYKWQRPQRQIPPHTLQHPPNYGSSASHSEEILYDDIENKWYKRYSFISKLTPREERFLDLGLVHRCTSACKSIYEDDEKDLMPTPYPHMEEYQRDGRVCQDTGYHDRNISDYYTPSYLHNMHFNVVNDPKSEWEHVPGHLSRKAKLDDSRFGVPEQELFRTSSHEPKSATNTLPIFEERRERKEDRDSPRNNHNLAWCDARVKEYLARNNSAGRPKGSPYVCQFR